jgi:hypothetical protein
MSLVSGLMRIVPIIDIEGECAGVHLYTNSIKNLLRRFLAEEQLFDEYQQEHMDELFIRLPLIRPSTGDVESSQLSVLLLCRQRPHAGKFFYEMLSRWLIPGKRLDFSLFFAADFRLPDRGDEVYTIAEIVFVAEDYREVKAMLKNFPLIDLEIRLGIASSYHASRILEIKGLSVDEKTVAIQELIASLIRRRPQDFDYDLFSQMQHFFVTCHDGFKAQRECKQMCRIIYVFYLFRKAVRSFVERFPKKRHLSFKLLNTRLHLPFGVKRVLSIFVGVNFLKENELFEENHLVSALRNYIPDVKAVSGSFVLSRSREDKIHTIYLEVEKEDGTPFSLEEVKRLRRGLPEDLKGRVEQLIRPVFMPRNEEEVMRNLLILSKQLKYKRDIPQVIISFDEQTDTELSFLVILVRVMQEKAIGVCQLLSDADTCLKFQVDRVKNMGMIRNKHPKEASVLRARLSNAQFLRKDHSVDLYKARQAVALELQKIFGDVRDYNGGMIAKQIEAFIALKDLLGEVGRRHDFLLENFFHAIFPVELRSVLPPEPLKALFFLLIEMMEKNERAKLLIAPGCTYALFHLHASLEEEKIFNIVNELHLAAPQLVSLRLKVLNTTYLGYIYFSDDLKKQETFREALSLDF